MYMEFIVTLALAGVCVIVYQLARHRAEPKMVRISKDSKRGPA